MVNAAFIDITQASRRGGVTEQRTKIRQTEANVWKGYGQTIVQWAIG